MTIYCHVCNRKGERATHVGLTMMAEAGWALTTQGYAANQCPSCNRKEDEKTFGKLPDGVTIERKPGFDHYEVTLVVEHADADFATRLLAAIAKFRDRYEREG